MFKKSTHIFGIVILLLVFSSPGFAQRYHLTYSSGHFSGDTADNYFKNSSSLGNLLTGESWLYAPVVFPDSANGMQVTRLSCTVRDNSTTGYIQAQLYKVDRWSAQSTLAGFVTTGTTFAATAVQLLNKPKSQISARGIDNNRWSWVLVVYFSEGNTQLGLSHVTLRYE